MPNNDAKAQQIHAEGEQIRASVTMQATPERIFAVCSDQAALRTVLDGITISRVSYSEVQVRGPGGQRPPWKGQVLKEDAARRIAWRSGEAEDAPSAGSINLHELPYQRGTVVAAVISYVPSKGAVGQAIAGTTRSAMEGKLKAALLRLRQWIEAGEVATTKGQSSGRTDGSDERGSTDEQKVSALGENLS